MRIAIFTDNDFAKVNGVTTTLQALLRWAPPDIRARIYTADESGAEDPQYLALRSLGAGIPYYREMKIYVPRIWSYLQHSRRDRIDLVHMTTPGPVGVLSLAPHCWRNEADRLEGANDTQSTPRRQMACLPGATRAASSVAAVASEGTSTRRQRPYGQRRYWFMITPSRSERLNKAVYRARSV